MPSQRYPFYQLQYPDGGRTPAWRLYLPLRIENPVSGASVMMYGLVDTGADSTLFPASLAAHLGHSLKGAGVKSNVTCGIEQNAVATYRHTFNVELLSPRGNRVTKKFEHIEIDCAESEPPILLGASDILCRFDISIRYRAGELLLRW